MSSNQPGFSNGILRGLKNILFTPDENEGAAQAQQPVPQAHVETAPVQQPIIASPIPATADESQRDMKLKVYQLLESMNQPGCDFFEVWNAASEMGGASAVNIKTAFTTLKFADKTLTKSKLIETGETYIRQLGNVLATETAKRQEEKTRLETEKGQLKTNLTKQIENLEKQLLEIQQQLASKTNERDNINAKFVPAIAEIDSKISAGQQSVNSVLSEMTDVLTIIQKEIIG